MNTIRRYACMRFGSITVFACILSCIACALNMCAHYASASEDLAVTHMEQLKIMADIVTSDGKSAEEDPYFTSMLIGDTVFEVMFPHGPLPAGSKFSVNITIKNPSDDDFVVDIWSYIYTGSRCVSGNWKDNMVNVNLMSGSVVRIVLEGFLEADAIPGNYTLKVRFLRSDRKTPKDVTFPVMISIPETPEDKKDNLMQITGNSSLSGDSLSKELPENSLSDSDSSFSTAQAPQSASGDNEDDSRDDRRIHTSELGDSSSGEVVYKSSSARAKDLAVYFLVVVLLFVLIALVMGKL